MKKLDDQRETSRMISGQTIEGERSFYVFLCPVEV